KPGGHAEADRAVRPHRASQFPLPPRPRAATQGQPLARSANRLSRSLLDFSGLVEQSRREGWQLVALDLGVDTSTPSGEMLANVLAVFAQFERRLIGQRTREALAIKRAQGGPARPPAGDPGGGRRAHPARA